MLPWSAYDAILLQFSGGKDSVASFYALLDAGAPLDKIELWHQLPDGEPGATPFMDWPVTEAYVRAFGEAVGVPVWFQWKHGGMLGEMMRENAPTAPTSFETPSGIYTVGGRGPLGTRRKFPQVSGDLRVRWCSAYLKIDVAAKAITNDPRFNRDATVLVVTGERREESPGRARYAMLEPHKADQPGRRRRVDHWRPVLDWNEAMVWDRMRRAGIRPHPVYDLGYGRASCATCIFSGPNEWATMKQLAPQRFRAVADKQREFGVTIARKASIQQRAAKGSSFVPRGELLPARRAVLSQSYTPDIEVSPAAWKLPRGAFKKTAGPT